MLTKTLTYRCDNREGGCLVGVEMDAEMPSSKLNDWFSVAPLRDHAAARMACSAACASEIAKTMERQRKASRRG